MAGPTGIPLAELTTASGKRVSYKRNGVPEASCSISLEDDAAYLVWETLKLNGIPRLKAYRDGALRFNGYLAPFTEDAEDAAVMNLVFRGPFGRLLGDGDGAGYFTTEIVDKFADAGQIAKELIDTANAAGATGVVTTGAIETTKVRERTYEYANVGESIIQLTEVLDGFDFECVPIDQGANMGEFTVYARQGSDKPEVRFEYGADTLANVQSVSRGVRPPVNSVRLLGSDGVVAEVNDTASRDKYGLWPRQESISDLEDDLVALDKAYALLRPDPIKTVTFQPDPALSFRPWDDFWLGDTVRFNARRGAMVEEAATRVNEIQVVIDDEGNESYETPDPTDPSEERTIKALMSVEVI